MAKGDFGRWMQEAQRRVTEWSRGRNGTDRLSMAVMNVAVLLVVVDVVARTRWLSVIAMLLLAYAWFRITSKDIAARAAENARAMRAAGPVLSWLANPVAEAREARAYKHLSCPSCGQRVRIPRGKGKVRVTCPSCHARFEGKA